MSAKETSNPRKKVSVSSESSRPKSRKGKPDIRKTNSETDNLQKLKTKKQKSDLEKMVTRENGSESPNSKLSDIGKHAENSHSSKSIIRKQISDLEKKTNLKERRVESSTLRKRISFTKKLEKNESDSDILETLKDKNEVEDVDKDSPDDTASDVENGLVQKVFYGDLDSLPGLGSKIVRIFTSSTFTDTKVERNALMEKIYPKIKEYCREKHGLEFQVVDMRWGVRDEATDDHMTTELCLQEIETCQRLSTGPNFVLFICQKYGYRPMPAKILGDEFEKLCNVLKDKIEDTTLLTTWYKKDENAIPAVYILQPISSILVNFNNKRNKALMESDQDTWWGIFERIRMTLAKAANVLYVMKRFTEEQLHNYRMSVTEREVVKGILKAANVNDHCLVYMRTISNLDTVASAYARYFMDFAGWSIDTEAGHLLERLRDKKLPAKLPESNIARFSVDWSGEGIDSDVHKDYLEQFLDHFYEHCIELVERAVLKQSKLSEIKVYGESLQHLHMCNMFCRIFQGREEVIEMIKEYICGSSTYPLILHGESGCGKTSLLAKGASEVKSWMKDKSKCQPVLILRFLGTSPDSSSILPLLISLCEQISHTYDLPVEDIPGELQLVTQHLKNILESATAEKPLVMFLDSLDQLSRANGAHQLNWLPSEIPDHVKVVVSTLPNYYDILDTLKKMVPNEENFIQIKPLGQNLSSTILVAWLRGSNRAITEKQWDIVNEALTHCNLPLFVRLVFDKIIRWKSYSSPATTTLKHSINDSIMQLYERIEIQHGQKLVSHALGFITASKSGISESELEDLLSLDEDVLNDVYQYHLPPVRRIPPLLWTRIRNDLPHYLSEREADGINVINWYHRQFIEASRSRYFQNVNFLNSIHSMLAEYFRGTWASKPKPCEFSDLQKMRFDVAELPNEADRKVMPQPLVIVNEEGAVIRHNLRKLSEMPFHLVRSHRFDDLFNEVLFNYKWLHAKLSCMPLQAVIADFEDAMEHYQTFTGKTHKEMKLVADTLRLSSTVLNKNPDMLGPQIVGRLLPYYGKCPYIRKLINECDTDGLYNCALVPAHHCFHTPGGPLKYSFEKHELAPFGAAVTSNISYLVSVSNKFIIWDMKTAAMFREIEPPTDGLMQDLVLSPDDCYAVTYTTTNNIIICRILTGETTIINKIFDPLMPIIGITTSKNNFGVWNSKEWVICSYIGIVISRSPAPLKGTIVGFGIISDDCQYLSIKPDDGERDLILHMVNSDLQNFECHSSMVFSKDLKTLYTCIDISDDQVVEYKINNDEWVFERTLDDKAGNDQVYHLTLSNDDEFLAATYRDGYKLWDLTLKYHQTMKILKFPMGGEREIRNLPVSPPLLGFSADNKFLIACNKEVIYIWATETTELTITLAGHFERIKVLKTISNEEQNLLISSSIDKTIKVWNIENINDTVHTLPRMEKAIDSINLATDAYIAASVARSAVGVWDIEKGQLKTTFSSTGNAIVTHACITPDAHYVISAESGKIIVWDIETNKILKQESAKDCRFILLTEDGNKYNYICDLPTGMARLTQRELPSNKETFSFQFKYGKAFREPVLSSCTLFFVIPAISNDKQDILSLYHSKTGTHVHDWPLKYDGYKEYIKLIPMPDIPQNIAIIDNDKGNIVDVRKKHFLRSIPQWNGVCTPNGKFGLSAPTIGGLYILDLQTGATVRTLVPRVAEGVFSVMTGFTKDGQHVLYYHSGHNSLRIFRISDGKMLANYIAQARVNSIVGTEGGASIVLGSVDGTLTTLNIVDPENNYCREVLKSIRSRFEIEVVIEKMELFNNNSKPAQTEIKNIALDKKGEKTAEKIEIGTKQQNLSFNAAVKITANVAKYKRAKALAADSQAVNNSKHNHTSKACILS